MHPAMDRLSRAGRSRKQLGWLALLLDGCSSHALGRSVWCNNAVFLSLLTDAIWFSPSSPWCLWYERASPLSVSGRQHVVGFSLVSVVLYISSHSGFIPSFDLLYSASAL